jgi:hypothetical protein
MVCDIFGDTEQNVNSPCLYNQISCNYYAYNSKCRFKTVSDSRTDSKYKLAGRKLSSRSTKAACGDVADWFRC